MSMYGRERESENFPAARSMVVPEPHVVVVAFPFASHTVKLFRLARALAAAAPSATFSFLSTAGSIVQLRNAGALEGNLRFVEVSDGLPPAGAVEMEVSHLKRIELFLAAAECGGLRDALEAARDSAGGAMVSCVVGDAFMWMAAEAAAAAKTPWVPVWTGGPSALLVHLRADALRDDVGDNAASRADEPLTSHPGLGSYRVQDLPDGIVFGDFNFPITVLFRRMAQRLARAATAVALNTFPGLLPYDVTAALAVELPNCLPIGPFHLLPTTDSSDTDTAPADPYGCLTWLDRHPTRTIVYVSFGTLSAARPEELPELAAGLEETGMKFLWSVPEECWLLLPPGFLERAKAGAGLVVPWAPQVPVLRHASVGTFVTHAGWASVLEGVCSGVPMACRPFFSDQRMNARLVSHVWGFGTTFDGRMTRGGVATALTSLMSDEEGSRMRARMQELQGMAASAFAPDGGSRKNLDKLLKIVCEV